MKQKLYALTMRADVMNTKSTETTSNTMTSLSGGNTLVDVSDSSQRLINNASIESDKFSPSLTIAGVTGTSNFKTSVNNIDNTNDTTGQVSLVDSSSSTSVDIHGDNKVRSGMVVTGDNVLVGGTLSDTITDITSSNVLNNRRQTVSDVGSVGTSRAESVMINNKVASTGRVEKQNGATIGASISRQNDIRVVDMSKRDPRPVSTVFTGRTSGRLQTGTLGSTITRQNDISTGRVEKQNGATVGATSSRQNDIKVVDMSNRDPRPGSTVFTGKTGGRLQTGTVRQTTVRDDPVYVPIPPAISVPESSSDRRRITTLVIKENQVPNGQFSSTRRIENRNTVSNTRSEVRSSNTNVISTGRVEKQNKAAVGATISRQNNIRVADMSKRGQVPVSTIMTGRTSKESEVRLVKTDHNNGGGLVINYFGGSFSNGRGGKQASTGVDVSRFNTGIQNIVTDRKTTVVDEIKTANDKNIIDKGLTSDTMDNIIVTADKDIDVTVVKINPVSTTTREVSSTTVTDTTTDGMTTPSVDITEPTTSVANITDVMETTTQTTTVTSTTPLSTTTEGVSIDNIVNVTTINTTVINTIDGEVPTPSGNIGGQNMKEKSSRSSMTFNIGTFEPKPETIGLPSTGARTETRNDRNNIIRTTVIRENDAVVRLPPPPLFKIEGLDEIYTIRETPIITESRKTSIKRIGSTEMSV